MNGMINHLLSFCMLGLPGLLLAQGGHVHVHGHAELFIALNSDRDLAIEFKAPAADIFGFESLGQQAERQEKVQKQVAILKKPEQLLQLVARSDCKYQPLKIAAFGQDLLKWAPSSKSHDHSHDHKNTSKDSKKGHHHGDHGQHSDLLATFSITCEKPLAGQKIELQIIEKFPSIKDLSVVLLGEKAQKKWGVKQARFEINL